MSSPSVSFSPSYCSHCGTRFDAGVKFCAGCGRPAAPAGGAPAGAMPPPIVAVAQADDIATLEDNVAEHPDDESYRKLLAVALHDDAMNGWWEDPEDKSLLCVSRQGLNHARAQLTRANQLQFNDPELRGHIQDKLRLVDSMEARQQRKQERRRTASDLGTPAGVQTARPGRRAGRTRTASSMAEPVLSLGCSK